MNTNLNLNELNLNELELNELELSELNGGSVTLTTGAIICLGIGALGGITGYYFGSK